eukprot:1455246-Pyramimonas_sp.AAC.1
MTALMRDAADAFKRQSFTQEEHLPVSELIYAGDALVVGTNGQFVSALMMCIQEAGKHYVLAFNWSKIEAMPIRCQT